MEKQNPKNAATMAGTIVTKPTIYEIHGEKFWDFQLEIERQSGNTDTICVSASKLLLDNPKAGDKYCFDGEIRSYRKEDESGKNHLRIAMLAKDAYKYTEPINHVEIECILCKEPLLRTTPNNWSICDLLVAVNRRYGNSSYLPCVVWGRKARFASHIAVGAPLLIEGRLQSREYTKRLDNGETEQKTAYEISVSRIVPMDEEAAENGKDLPKYLSL